MLWKNPVIEEQQVIEGSTVTQETLLLLPKLII